jgi:hypothetical protein
MAVAPGYALLPAPPSIQSAGPLALRRRPSFRRCRAPSETALKTVAPKPADGSQTIENQLCSNRNRGTGVRRSYETGTGAGGMRSHERRSSLPADASRGCIEIRDGSTAIWHFDTNQAKPAGSRKSGVSRLSSSVCDFRRFMPYQSGFVKGTLELSGIHQKDGGLRGLWRPRHACSRTADTAGPSAGRMHVVPGILDVLVGLDRLVDQDAVVALDAGHIEILHRFAGLGVDADRAARARP